MGTRNLTMVIQNSETKVAQYGQWDGYPEGQGKTALNFLRSVNLDAFREKLSHVKWVDADKQAEVDAYLLSIGCADEWMTLDQGAKYKNRYPLFSRDNGAKVLQMIMEYPDSELYLNDQSSFAADSLFCEWAYVIDLDKNTFEVYQGFNKEPLDESDRFFALKGGKEYQPVKMVKSYDLSELPNEDQFIDELEKATAEESES